MIINIRGVEGSGKTTAAKTLYKEFSTHKTILYKNSIPILTLCSGNPNLNDTAFIGPYANTDPLTYDSQVSGADIVPNLDKLRACINFCVSNSIDVVYENSKFQSMKFLKELSELDNVLVFNLTASKDTVIEQIKKRSNNRRTSYTSDYDSVQRTSVELSTVENIKVIDCISLEVARHLYDNTVKRNRSEYSADDMITLRTLYDTEKSKDVDNNFTSLFS